MWRGGRRFCVVRRGRGVDFPNYWGIRFCSALLQLFKLVVLALPVIREHRNPNIQATPIAERRAKNSSLDIKPTVSVRAA